MEEAARVAASLTGQMLAYSGRGRFVVESLDVSGVAQKMARLLDASISKDVKLVYELSPDLPSVEGDNAQLGQVIMNLITNASEATGEAGGRVTIRTGALWVDADYLGRCLFSEDREEGFYVFVEVSDDGVGMDEDTVAKIFDPFFSTKFTGRGLGLATVLGIVKGHGGTIRVVSAPTVGTSMTVLLPSAETASVDGSAGRDSAASSKRGTVLVVDDDNAVRRVICSSLRSHDYRVLEADDGRAGLGVFKRNAEGIVCVVLDMTMPVMDGRETYARIRDVSSTVPVLLISGYAREDAAKAIEDSALLEFLQKPFSAGELLAKIEELRNVAQGMAARSPG